MVGLGCGVGFGVILMILRIWEGEVGRQTWSPVLLIHLYFYIFLRQTWKLWLS